MKRQKYIKTKSYPLVCNICILLLFVSMKSLYFQQVVCRTISCKFCNVQLCKMCLINLDRYFVIFLWTCGYVRTSYSVRKHYNFPYVSYTQLSKTLTVWWKPQVPTSIPHISCKFISSEIWYNFQHRIIILIIFGLISNGNLEHVSIWILR